MRECHWLKEKPHPMAQMYVCVCVCVCVHACVLVCDYIVPSARMPLVKEKASLNGIECVYVCVSVCACLYLYGYWF